MTQFDCKSAFGLFSLLLGVKTGFFLIKLKLFICFGKADFLPSWQAHSSSLFRLSKNHEEYPKKAFSRPDSDPSETYSPLLAVRNLVFIFFSFSKEAELFSKLDLGFFKKFTLCVILIADS